MAKQPTEESEKYATNSLKTYIQHGNQPLNWIAGIIQSSGLRGEDLLRIFYRLEEYPRNSEEERFRQVYGLCEGKGWF
ncbi:MAG: hypothetical protein L0154_11395 [Chloroflexi bacterium]|nr:hypothetical protein [Chloroflexota bacterium]